MNSKTSDFIHLLKFKLKLVWNFNIIIQLEKRYKIKFGYIILAILFLLIFGFSLGLSIARFELTKQILSAPVFASVFGVLIGVFGIRYIKKKDFTLLNSKERQEVLNKIFILKEPFSLETISLSKEIGRNFNKKVISILINFLLRKALNQQEDEEFAKLELQMNLELKSESFSPKEEEKTAIYNLYLLLHILSQNFSKEQIYDYIVKTLDTFIIMTDTVPGIFCRIEDALAAQKIYELKKRSVLKPLAVYSTKPIDFVLENQVVKKFLNHFDGTPITLVSKLKGNIPNLSKLGDFVGVRIVKKSSNFYKFLERNKVTLLGTSANISGTKTPKNINELDKTLTKELLVIDLEEEGVSLETSVIKIDAESLTIMREGFNIESITKWVEAQGGKLILNFESGEEKKTYIINEFN